MVYELFGVIPDKWQELALQAFADNRPELQRIAMQACAGPGKSAVLAWIAINFMLCYCSPGEHPKGAAVSMTWDNLKDNLWSEIYKWYSRNEYLKQEFVWTQTRFYAKDHPETWFISARSFAKSADKEEQGRTLSGLHAKYVLFLIDESGSVPPEVGKAAEQALSNCEFGKIVTAGNPTSHDGLLYAASKDSKWFKIRINGDPDDPMRSPRIDINWASEQIKEFGRKDPWVMAMILGLFPESSITTLLTDEDVDRAVARNITDSEIQNSMKKLGVDVARFGDDSSIIFPRQGLQSYMYVEMRKADGPMLANRVLGAIEKWRDVDQILVDGTGGYGASCIDFLRQAGQAPMEVQFSSQASNPKKFYNIRAEMYWRGAEWIKKHGSLIDDKELRKELVGIQYSFSNDKILLEPKEQMKKRLGFSPDKADAFMLTFATPEALKPKVQAVYDKQVYHSRQSHQADEYDPWK